MNSPEVKKFKAFLNSMSEGDYFVLFDTETEGLNPKEHHIIEMAAKLVDKNLDVIGLPLQVYINPKRPLSEKIVELTGITDEFLADKPTEDKVIGLIENYFDGRACVAYNTPFDVRMTNALYERQKKGEFKPLTFDVCQMAREVLRDDPIENKKLGIVAEYLGCDAGIKFHDALDDVEATLRVLRALVKLYEDEAPDTPIKVGVMEAWYWRGYNSNQAGVYVQTDRGKISYHPKTKIWRSKELDIDYVDIDDLRRQLFERYKVGSEDELAKQLAS